jgi:adenylate cyclase
LTGERVERRLAAILAADVAGFSALMERDEEGTYSRIGSLRQEVIEPRLSEHQGRLIKTTGDGFLAEFASPIAALRCALAIQSAQLDDPNALRLRIGLNLGDVIIEDGGDVYGEGVNVAARLEGLADPGGILISGKIHNEVEGKVEAAFEDRGEQPLKNITRPVRVYAVRPATAVGKASGAIATINDANPLPLPDKPSIAVLPFQNMSGDPQQEYFADGMVEDIITALSRFKSLFVIARNSSFTYKGKAVDIKLVGRELGVRYVLEGSVRKAAGRVRITGQLIDAETGSHLWADRFEGNLEDVFELQDQVTASVVGELITQVQFAETQRAHRKPTNSLDACECHLRGMAQVWRWTKDNIEAALAYFLKAIELEENFALAYAWAGQMYVLRKQSRWMVNVEQESAEAVRLARLAIELGQMDDMAQCMGGFVLAYVAGELDLAAECIDRGLAMNTNLAVGWNFSGWVHMYLGNHQTAIEHQRRSERLSPRDPNLMQIRLGLAFAHIFNGQFEQASHMAERITGEFPAFVPAWRVMAASYALRGDLALAGRATKKAMELDPAGKVSMLAPQMPLRRLEDRERWKEGLLRAGFPE